MRMIRIEGCDCESPKVRAMKDDYFLFKASKIEIIKKYRIYSNLGLKESKDQVETWEKEEFPTLIKPTIQNIKAISENEAEVIFNLPGALYKDVDFKVIFFANPYDGIKPASAVKTFYYEIGFVKWVNWGDFISECRSEIEHFIFKKRKEQELEARVQEEKRKEAARKALLQDQTLFNGSIGYKKKGDKFVIVGISSPLTDQQFSQIDRIVNHNKYQNQNLPGGKRWVPKDQYYEKKTDETLKKILGIT